MNHQTDIFRKTLESIANNGAVEYRYGTTDHFTIEPSYRGQAKQLAQEFLDNFPEEGSENVRAYRAIMYLIEFLDRNDIDEPEFGGETTIQRLYYLRQQVKLDAEKDIQERLMFEERDTLFDDMTDAVIHDPTSKYTRKVSSMYEDDEEMKRLTAREVLEDPL